MLLSKKYSEIISKLKGVI